MSNKFVRSTDGSNSDNGSTWALAKANLKDALAIAAAGDIVYVSQLHAETNNVSTTITAPAGITNPVVIIGANDASEPPTAVSNAPTVLTTGASNLTIVGSISAYGINFTCGNGYNYSVLRVGYSSTDNAIQRFESCNFVLADTHPASTFGIGSSGGIVSEVILKNCGLKVASGLDPINLSGKITFSGGGFLTGTAVSSLGCFSIGSSGVAASVSIEDFDFSTLPTTTVLFRTPTASSSGNIKARNCKLPAGWTGRLIDAAFTSVNTRVEMWNCDSGDTNYKLWIETGAGVIRDETTVVMAGGATDGTTASSIKMTSNANASEEGQRLSSPELLVWCDTIGTPKTATVEIIHDSATALTDAEIWLELDYLGTAGATLGITANSRRATVLTTPAAQPSSTATWTTTGLSTPNKQKLTITFTPQEIGWVQARVMLAKASKTVYINQASTVT